MLVTAFSPLPIVFSTLSNRKIVTFEMFHLSANAFNLVTPKLLSFSKGLTLYHLKKQILDLSKLEVFADHSLSVAQMLEFLFHRVGNNLENKKMLVTSIFSFSHNVFKRTVLFSRFMKTQDYLVKG